MPDPLKTLAAALAELGFRKRAGYVLTTELTGDVIGWLGFNRASRYLSPGELDLNVVVGVRHQGIEEVVASCRGERFHGYLPPTASRPIGYLMPQRRYHTWRLSPATPPEVFSEIVEAIAANALPFMRSLQTLPAVRQWLEGNPDHEHQRRYRLPVARLLDGDDAGALALVEATLVELEGRTDAAAEDLRPFCEALRQRIRPDG